MKNLWGLCAGILLATLLVQGPPAAAEEAVDIPLMTPVTEGGMPLFQALKERKSIKEFSNQPLTAEFFSNLLWAAYGINRQDSGKRTAPSAKNNQEVSVYVFMAEGTYLYEAAANRLKYVAAGVLPLEGASTSPAESAPLELLYVADLAKSAGKTDEEKRLYAAITAGCIIQNVYLFCASEKLGSVTRAVSNRDALVKILGLTKDQWPIMSQAVGFPLPNSLQVSLRVETGSKTIGPVDSP